MINMIEHNKEYRILFQGDSITYANRIKMIKSSLGVGYCSMIGKYIKNNYGEKITCLNKGIYGDTTTRLKKRWIRDSIEINPDILSILIGVNDCWRRYDRGIVTTIEQFTENYDYILKQSVESNENLSLVILSPFLIPLSRRQEEWFEDLNPKIKVVEELANKYNAIYIPLNDIFKEIVSNGVNARTLTRDGVHPTQKGHKIIAKTWIKAMDI